MSNIYFKPWVGRNYQKSTGTFGKRILVLGESHYQWDENIAPPLSPDLTIECIEAQISGDETHPFWTKITNVFLGEVGWRSLEEKEAFWHSIAFANFVQESVGFGPRERPKEDMWEKGRSAFLEMLSELHPHLIVVLGFELWENLPASEHKGPDMVNVPNDSKTTCFYPYPGGRALAFRMTHPSGRGFKYADWVAGLKEAGEKAPSD